jgi:hypothetical protein
MVNPGESPLPPPMCNATKHEHGTISGMSKVYRATLLFFLMVATACTVYRERMAQKFGDATGGEALERVFWNEVKAGSWSELEGVIASNYIATTPDGTLDRNAALGQYRQYKLKDFSIGDLKTELNGLTIVVAYNITLNGTVNGQPLPATPQHMMTVWQEQARGWVVIAHSVSQP